MEKKLFVREATGLVRELSVFDGLMFGLSATGGPGAALMFFVFLVATAIPGSDMISAILIGLPFGLCFMICYGFLTATMPRSGGEYVFVSRILSPVVGFTANWNLALWQVIAFGTYVPFIFSFGVSPAVKCTCSLDGQTRNLQRGHRLRLHLVLSSLLVQSRWCS